MLNYIWTSHVEWSPDFFLPQKFPRIPMQLLEYKKRSCGNSTCGFHVQFHFFSFFMFKLKEKKNWKFYYLFSFWHRIQKGMPPNQYQRSFFMFKLKEKNANFREKKIGPKRFFDIWNIIENIEIFKKSSLHELNALSGTRPPTHVLCIIRSSSSPLYKTF